MYIFSIDSTYTCMNYVLNSGILGKRSFHQIAGKLWFMNNKIMPTAEIAK